MNLLNDAEIKLLHPYGSTGMIDPFVPHAVRDLENRKCVSYGLSSVGYDIRLSTEFSRPLDYVVVGDMVGHTRFDPHDLESMEWIAETHESLMLLPGQMILGASLEYFNMPRDVVGVCLGKSTYARMGLFVNVTPLEPGWKGILTIELSNIGHIPIKVYANEGIAQILFFQVNTPEVTYADKNGKYQGQTGITTAKL